MDAGAKICYRAYVAVAALSSLGSAIMAASLRGLVIFLSWSIALFALVAYGFFPFGNLTDPLLLPGFETQRAVVYLHAFAAPVALLLGPLQLWPAIRNGYPQIHRWMGRVYLVAGVGFGGVSGLLMAQATSAGGVARAGFSLLAIAWLATGIAAYLKVRNGDYTAHRQWMIRNFSLTFAAVTLRLYIPLSVAGGIPFETAYPAIAWLCWVPNLIFAEFLLARNASPRTTAQRG
jgi:uncharacterized membrane protein